MKHTFGKHTSLACIALAAAAFMAPGAETANAQPSFASTTFSIERSGEAAGGLTCKWREVGLQPGQSVTYLCDAAVVGALEQCVSKNKIVGTNSQLIVVKNPGQTGEGGGGEEGEGAFIANNSGKINGTLTTAVPEQEGEGGGELSCTEPAEATVVAVRWCNASLTDVTNNIVGGTASELFQQFYSGAGAVPPCSTLLQ